jgi:hypothetical protein
MYYAIYLPVAINFSGIKSWIRFSLNWVDFFFSNYLVELSDIFQVILLYVVLSGLII